MAKSEFLSRMSHELRTPLNAVIGFGQLLELDDLEPDQDESVSQILKGGRHLLDLINEVLDISRIETGNLALSHEAVSVSEVIGDVVVLMRAVADERGITLRAQDLELGATNGIHVLADRRAPEANPAEPGSQRHQVQPPGRSGDRLARLAPIPVTAASSSPIPVRVSPSEGLSKLFVPFERLGAEATGVEGTGVGLALSRRLAEAMGGTLDLRSVVGEGSRFWVELPITEGPLQSATSGCTARSPKRPSRSPPRSQSSAAPCCT